MSLTVGIIVWIAFQPVSVWLSARLERRMRANYTEFLLRYVGRKQQARNTEIIALCKDLINKYKDAA